MYSLYKNKSFTIFNCVVLEIIGARICPINLTISIKICNIIITVFSRGCLVLYVSLVCYKWIHIRIAVLYEFTYFFYVFFYPLFSSMLIIRRTHVLVNVNPEHSFGNYFHFKEFLPIILCVKFIIILCNVPYKKDTYSFFIKIVLTTPIGLISLRFCFTL